MKTLRTDSTPVSNPSVVLRMIDSAGCNDGFAALLTSPTAKPAPRAATHLRLHVAPETESQTPEWFDLGQPPTRQIEQLVSHLRNRQKDLIQREADLQAQAYHWEQQVLSSKSHLRRRTSELEQHCSQVQLQQTQLVKLQQNLVDSQQALRVVIERIVDDCQPAELKAELHALRRELNERFDVILNRWERFKHSLTGIPA